MYSSHRPAALATNSRRERQPAAPLSTTSAASTSSRRQQLALFRHASTRRASAKTMTKTRQHAKQLAQQLSSTSNDNNNNAAAGAVDFFADFGAAFPDPEPIVEDLFAMAPNQSPVAAATANNNNALLRRRLARNSNSSSSGKLLHTNDSFASDDNGSSSASAFFDQDPFSPEAQQRAAIELQRHQYEQELQRQQEQQRQQQAHVLAQQALQQQAQMKARAQAQEQAHKRARAAQALAEQRAAARAAKEQAALEQQQHQQDLFQPDWSQQQTVSSPRIPAEASPRSSSQYHRSASLPPSFFPVDAPPPPPAARSHSLTGSNYMYSPGGSSAASSTAANVGGAAARRRVRNQIRKGGNESVEFSPSSSRHSMSQTPPQSPASSQKSAQLQQQQQRWQLQHQSDASSVGASSVGSHPRPTDKGSVGSTRSVTSSTASSSGPTDLFDTKHPDAGFRFDAFGLDESQIHREVTQAMQEIAHQDPNMSFFVEDDFANNSSSAWDHSPNPSRTATPTKDNNDEGFVDGFRVNKPHHPRHSPTSTERSSLTSDSSGRVNLFKQKAGFHESKPSRKVVMLADNGRRQSMSRQQQAPEVPKLQETILRRKSQDVDFFDAGFESSDAEGFESDVGGTNTSTTADPSEVPSSTEGSTRRHEEKKDDYDDGNNKRMTMEPLKSKWAMQAGARQPPVMQSPEPTTKKPMDIYRQAKAVHQSPVIQPKALDKSNVKSKLTSVDDAQIQQAPSYERRQSHQSISSGRSSPVSTHDEYPQQNSPARVSNSRPTPIANEDVQGAPSFESLRDRLRPVGSQDDKYVKSRSEGGAINISTVNTVLRRMESASSPNDSKSDVGAPSPAFAQVKLRRTLIVPKEKPQEQLEAPDTSNERQQEEEQRYEEPSEPERKLTYREKRELELQRQREEEEERRKAEEVEKPRNDVALQIKRRVASMAQQNANLPSIPTSHVSGTTLYQNLRSGSGQADSGTTLSQRDASSAFRQPSKAITPSTTVSPAREPVDLVIQPSTSGELDSSPSKEADAVVSRLLKLKQADNQVASSARTIDTGATSPSDNNGPNQLHTPKATMMMLNAFLAGREAIVSPEPGSAGQPTMIEVGEADTQGPEARTTASSPTHYPSDLPALKDDPKYAKFFKMLSIGMPMEVVKHAMTREGFNPAVMDQDHNKPVGIPLNRDPKYAKYFKMLAIGLPMDAVKHAMERDGLHSSVMDRDHSLPAQAMSSNEDAAEPKEKDSHRRARLHWKTLRKVTSNSMWAKIDQDDQLDNIEIDEAEFQELFQIEKADEANTSTVTTTTKASTKRGVCVIDPKRANNGGIILARLKMSHDEMADAVDRINENALTAEQIEHIIEYLPTKEERKSLEAYMLEGGQDAAEKFDRLCECEKFMVSMMTVKHAKRKVRALLFKLQFRTCLEDIYNDTVMVESACDELNNSVRLRQLFGIILTFGNRLNTVGSGKQRRAGAFTLDSLLKLKQAKAFDKKTTFLHYIVLIVRRNNEILLRFKDDLPSVFKADKIFWDQCVNDLEEVENQLENVRKISLYQARQSSAYRMRRKKRDDDAESLSDGDMDLSLEEEVDLLRSTPIGLFTLSAIKYVSSLRDKVEVTKTKFARLLEYFGDEDRKLQPHELFSIIVTFSRDFDKANDEVVANEKRKQREERKRQAVHKTGPGRPPTYSPAQKQGVESPLKASNHQPTMFHVLSEMKAKVAAKQATPSHPVHHQQLRRIEESPPDGSGREQPSPPLVQRARQDIDSGGNALQTGTPQTDRTSASTYPRTPSPSKVQRVSTTVPTSQERQMPAPNSPPQRVTSSQENLARPSPASSETSATPRTHNILREKARLRRQRFIQDRSPPTQPTAHVVSDQEMPPPPLVRNRSPETNDDGAAQPLSPRSSMRLRMEHRISRNRASTSTK